MSHDSGPATLVFDADHRPVETGQTLSAFGQNYEYVDIVDGNRVRVREVGTGITRVFNPFTLGCAVLRNGRVQGDIARLLNY